jgi:fibronectin-binding autotransporter adhesin
MVPGTRYVVPVIGAGALVVSAFTGALASRPAPFHEMATLHGKNQTINGKLTVNNVLRAKKNLSVYGHFYAHNAAQVWSGLLVHSGGVKTDTLDVSGPMAAQSATISSNLQAGTIQAQTVNGATLTLSGAGSVGGDLTVHGKVTGNGIDAGTGNITTSGLAATGQITAGSMATTGALTANNATLQSLAVSGTVNFAGATVTGLNVGSLFGGQLNTLNIGTPSATTAPLNLSENGKTANIGVDTTGNVTFGSALLSGTLAVGSNASVAGTLGVVGATSIGGSETVAGSLAVNGSGGITATSLTGLPTASNSSVPGTLTLTGGAINLAGSVNTTGGLALGGGSDLTLSTNNTTSASHVVAAGDRDVAGTVTITIPNSTAAGTDIATESGTGTTVSFTQPYTSVPNVVLTAASVPSPGSDGNPKVWVTPIQGSASGTYTGFTIHYVAPGAVSSTGTYQVAYNYHVIGS